MRERLSLVLDDLKNHRFVEGHVAVLLAFLMAALNVIVGYYSSAAWVDTALGSVAVLVLGVLVSNVIEIRRAQEYVKPSLPVSRFSVTRDGLPLRNSDLREAQSEIYVISLSLSWFSYSGRGLLTELVESGVKVHLAVANPHQSDGLERANIREIEAAHCVNNLAASIGINIERLAEWRASLSELLQSRSEIRVYDNLPTMSVIMIDPEGPSGQIHVELVPWGLDPSLRPSFAVCRSDSERLYKNLCERYLKVWKDARSYEAWKGAALSAPI